MIGNIRVLNQNIHLMQVLFLLLNLNCSKSNNPNSPILIYAKQTAKQSPLYYQWPNAQIRFFFSCSATEQTETAFQFVTFKLSVSSLLLNF